MRVALLLPYAACASAPAPLPAAPVSTPAVEVAAPPAPNTGPAFVAATVATVLVTGDLGTLGDWLHAPVNVEIQDSMDSEDKPHPPEVTVLPDAAAFSAWLAELHPHFACPDRPGAAPELTCRWGNGLEVIGEPTCDADGCCAFRPEGVDFIPLLHQTLYLDRVCTRDGALRAIYLLDGS